MRKPVALVALSSLLFSGCLIMSLHPFFTDKDAVFEQSLVGTWVDESGKATLTFKQFGANAYRITYHQKESTPPMGGKKRAGEPGELEGHFGRVGGSLFLDLYPDKGSWDRLKNELLAVHLAPTHTISKVWFEGDKLMIAGLSHDWLKDLVTQDSSAIPHEKVEGAIVLTASTEALQDFLKKYGNDPKAFGGGEEFHREIK